MCLQEPCSDGQGTFFFSGIDGVSATPSSHVAWRIGGRPISDLSLHGAIIALPGMFTVVPTQAICLARLAQLFVLMFRCKLLRWILNVLPVVSSRLRQKYMTLELLSDVSLGENYGRTQSLMGSLVFASAKQRVFQHDLRAAPSLSWNTHSATASIFIAATRLQSYPTL